MVGWALIATFLIESLTLLWIPAKEAAVPNLIPRARLEAANQLTLITTYGLTPVAAAIGLAVLDRGVRGAVGGDLPTWAEPAQLALWFNAFSRLATALVVAFGIKEISEAQRGEAERAEQSMFRQFSEGWKYIGQTPLVRGLVLGIFGAFAGGGIVVGTAKFFATSLGAGDAAFSLLFGAIFVGLALGIGLGPMIVRELSRRRWFGMSIVLASAAVMTLAFAIHLSMAIVGAVLVGAGAGMAFLAGTTLLGGEVADEVRGRVFAVVQIGTRLVLMLAIALSSVLVGVGGSRKLDDRRPRHLRLLHPAAAARRRCRRHLRRDQRVRPDGRQEGRAGPRRPLGLHPGPPADAGRAVRLRRALRGLRGRRGRRQVHPARRARRAAARPGPRRRGHPRARGHRGRSADPRRWCWTPPATTRPPRAPRRCSTPPTGPTTWPPSSGPRWSGARW